MTLFSEANNLLEDSEMYYNNAKEMINSFTQNINILDKVPEELRTSIEQVESNVVNSITSGITNILTGITNWIMEIPNLVLSIFFSAMALYFLCTDKIYMIDQLEHHLPETWVKRIGVHLKALVKSLGDYLKAELTLVVISFFISLVGLYIFYFLGWNIEFPLLIALRNSLCRCIANIWLWNSNATLGWLFSIYRRPKISNRNFCFMVHNEHC